jgi:hypothetical protein
MVHEDGTHAHEDIVFQGAAVYDSAVSDRHIVPDRGRRPLIGTVEDGSILHIDFVAYPDGVDISADNSLKPYATIVSHDDISHNGSVFCQKTVVPKPGQNSVDWFYEWHTVYFMGNRLATINPNIAFFWETSHPCCIAPRWLKEKLLPVAKNTLNGIFLKKQAPTFYKG